MNPIQSNYSLTVFPVPCVPFPSFTTTTTNPNRTLRGAVKLVFSCRFCLFYFTVCHSTPPHHWTKTTVYRACVGAIHSLLERVCLRKHVAVYVRRPTARGLTAMKPRFAKMVSMCVCGAACIMNLKNPQTLLLADDVLCWGFICLRWYLCVLIAPAWSAGVCVQGRHTSDVFAIAIAFTVAAVFPARLVLYYLCFELHAFPRIFSPPKPIIIH